MSIVYNDTATTEIYALSLHDALPISLIDFVEHNKSPEAVVAHRGAERVQLQFANPQTKAVSGVRSEEHTSELQSRQYLVCRLLLEKKNKANSAELSDQINIDIVLKFE